MKRFEDAHNNLIWINYHNHENKGFLSFIKSKIFSIENTKIKIPPHSEAIKNLNSWIDNDKSQNIKKYITQKNNSPLGDFFENKYFLPFSPDYKEDNNSNFYQFFAYKMIDNIPTLVGTLLINHCLRFEFQDYIEYLVVNPHYQNRGIGTQMLSSILQNPSNFTNSENPKNLVGYIHCDNIPSLKLVKKLGFKEFTYPHFDDYNYLYSTSYLAFIYNVKEMNSDRTKN